ncbi:MAG: hypothetical protein O7A04_07610 [Acidobacteria bacterium]|nr:hypothetical protein [Acidobacteriota bacterium]
MATPDAPSAIHYTHNAVDYSEFVGGVGFTKRVNVVEATYADAGTVARAPGVTDYELRTVGVQEHDDYAISMAVFTEVGTERAVVFRPNDAVQASGNPELGGQAFISEFSLDVAAGGDAATSFSYAVNGALTWAES